MITVVGAPTSDDRKRYGKSLFAAGIECFPKCEN